MKTIVLILLLALHPLDAFFKEVSFEKSFFDATVLEKPNPNGRLFQALYEAYQNETEISEEYIIPKMIHFVWVGSPVPLPYKKFIASWKRLHPDWIVKVWTDQAVAFLGLRNQYAYDSARNFGEKADIARYEILYRYGGVYVDIDFECVKPFDNLHKSCEVYAGINGDNECLLNGLIGIRAGHPIMKACIENIKAGPGDHDEMRIMKETGPYFFTKMFVEYASRMLGKVVPFPPSFFYSFPGSFRHLKNCEEIKREFLKPESLAIHYWASSWMINKE